MDKVVELKRCIKSMTIEAEKFFVKNNNSAGVRMRKKLQECKRISQDIRILVQNIKFKYIQKKAKIKARRAAYLGETVLVSQEFRLKCLKENKSKNLKIKNNDNFYEEKKNNPNVFKSELTNTYEFENLLGLKTPTPIPTYSIFNHDI